MSAIQRASARDRARAAFVIALATGVLALLNPLMLLAGGVVAVPILIVGGLVFAAAASVTSRSAKADGRPHRPKRLFAVASGFIIVADAIPVLLALTLASAFVTEGTFAVVGALAAIVAYASLQVAVMHALYAAFHRDPPPTACTSCGYDLRGLPEAAPRCPECGEVIRRGS